MEILRKGSKGESVKVLQKALGIAVDGLFGGGTESGVIAFQLRHGLEADGVVGRRTWEALFPNGESCSLKKSKRNITEIIVHCTATREGQDVSLETVRRWHVQGNGWSDIAYNYLITLDGIVHEGRNVDVAGGHTKGHNAHSIGVCYVGGLAADGKTPKDTRTPAQRTALRELLQGLRKLYPTAVIYGHRDFANKACPSFDARKEYERL